MGAGFAGGVGLEAPAGRGRVETAGGGPKKEVMIPPRIQDNLLVPVVQAGIVLLLLTPFVVSPWTVFPFVVGKALYSRTLIEIVLVSWALLALFNPRYRPPRSRMLILLAAALGVAVLSAGFGVSVQRSLWSNYERMQGVVDQAHWFALALVLVSVLRTDRDWHVALALNAAAGTAMAVIAVAEYYGDPRIDVPGEVRVIATIGNPIFLAAYLAVNATIALGFLIRSFVPPAHSGEASASSEEGHGERPDRRNPPRQPRSARLLVLWAGRCFWGAAALTGLWAIILTASRGPFLGFVSGLVFVAAAYLFLARRRTVRLAAAGAAGLLGIVTAAFLVLSFSPAVSLVDTLSSNPLLSRLATHKSLGPVRQRLSAWEAGIDGFAASPGLGWGPENYIAIWGKHGSEFAASVPGVMDHSHNKLIEELATKGLAGLLVHAAIWGLAFHIVLRTVRAAGSRERVPASFAGAALAGYFVQSMTSPDTAVGSLQLVLLLAFTAHLETAGSGRPAPAQGGRTRPPAPSFTGKLAHLAGSHRVRVSLAAGTIVLAGAGLLVNRDIHSSARAVHAASVSATNPEAPLERIRIRFERAINGFKPLANYPRQALFQYAAAHWERLHARNRPEARQLLAAVNAEAAAAVESEPENWRIYVDLVRVYTAVAVTDPEYRDSARRYRDRARELAPYRRI